MNSKRTLLITGGSGYLGRHLIVPAAKLYTVYATYSTQGNEIKTGYPAQLDLTDRAAVLRLITDLAPQAIIHTAAANPGAGQDMMAINAGGSRYVAEGAVEVGARLVHVSTDVVHGGDQAPYDDDVPPTPINDYGRSKAAAEAAIAEVDPGAAMVRTSLIYGLEEMDRGTESFVQRLATGEPLVLFNDVIRQPVWVETLVLALLKLASLDVAGTLNVAGRQALTREEFGRRMLAWWQLDQIGELQSGRAAAVSPTIPLDLRLKVDRAERLLKMTFPGVDDVLALARERKNK